MPNTDKYLDSTLRKPEHPLILLRWDGQLVDEAHARLDGQGFDLRVEDPRTFFAAPPALGGALFVASIDDGVSREGIAALRRANPGVNAVFVTAGDPNDYVQFLYENALGMLLTRETFLALLDNTVNAFYAPDPHDAFCIPAILKGTFCIDQRVFDRRRDRLEIRADELPASAAGPAGAAGKAAGAAVSAADAAGDAADEAGSAATAAAEAAERDRRGRDRRQNRVIALGNIIERGLDPWAVRQRIIDTVAGFFDAHDLSWLRGEPFVEIGIDELVSNVLKHAYAEDEEKLAHLILVRDRQHDKLIFYIQDYKGRFSKRLFLEEMARTHDRRNIRSAADLGLGGTGFRFVRNCSDLLVVNIVDDDLTRFILFYDLDRIRREREADDVEPARKNVMVMHFK